MPADDGSGAAGGRGSCPATCRSDPVGPNLPLESSSRCGKRVDRDVFVDVNRLGVLSQVIQPRESPRAVALKGTLASMFSISPS